MNTQATAEQLADVNNDVEDTEVEATETDTRDTTTAEVTPVPTKEELALLCTDIASKFNFDVDVKPVLFRFKTAVEKDKDGKVISETKREALELPVPYPSIAGIIAILEGGGTEEGKKGLELLVDAVEAIVTAQVRSVITEDPSLTALTLPVDQLSWDFISKMPKPERMGGGIAKEVWEDFGKDYIKVMPEVAGKTVEQITNAAKLLVGKFAAVKTNKPVLKLLMEQLTLYISNSERADEFTPCVDFLVDKADKLLHVTPEELLANL